MRNIIFILVFSIGFLSNTLVFSAPNVSPKEFCSELGKLASSSVSPKSFAVLLSWGIFFAGASYLQGAGVSTPASYFICSSISGAIAVTSLVCLKLCKRKTRKASGTICCQSGQLRDISIQTTDPPAPQHRRSNSY